MHYARTLENHKLASRIPLISATAMPWINKCKKQLPNKVLDLVHPDACSFSIMICAVKFVLLHLEGINIFVTFTDDYSRFKWIYFMKSKSNTLKHFLTFKVAAELTLRAKIEQFRLDNGREYIGGAF